MSKYENGEKEKKEEKSEQKSQKKMQTQRIQEALGLGPEEVENVEKKFFIARFMDYFSEEAFDFIYKDSSIEQFETQINTYMDDFSKISEEGLLLKESFESKDIFNSIRRIKKNAEELAAKYGRDKPIEKSMRNMNFIMIAVLIGLMFIFFIPGLELDFWILLPVMCLFCMLPQVLRGAVLKKWFEFKETHKNEFYKENREEILILKNYAAEILDNVRTSMLDKKVPIQLIKFMLYSRDYENVKVLNQKTIKGTTQYVFTFEYPEGMEPFPIPETLQINQPAVPEGTNKQEIPEKNFIVLSQVKTDAGRIKSYIPILKDFLAIKINKVLEESEFSLARKKFSEIIPNYYSDLAIFCVCGELADIESVQIANWKNRFKFYLFEARKCACNEQIFALSVMDEDAQIPDELKEIFKS